jgi:hypothetical protein
MKASQDFLKQLEQLFETYEQEVTAKMNSGLLAKNTEQTYLLHSGNFVKWCRGEFIPGGRNEKK